MRGDPLTATASFTRPADTTQYAAGDLVANSATAGSVAMMEFKFPRAVWLRKIKLNKSDPDLTGATFRLWLHSDSVVTFANGDNGALSVSGLPVGAIAHIQDFSTMTQTLTGVGDFVIASITSASGGFGDGIRLPQTTYGFLEARGTYTPGNAEVFTVELFGEAYR